ncbi:MAG: C4-dicarboxylate transporter [Oscillospiraceae bacterium]|jgi:tripartite ATP-independent transporter DctM subunit|nr:C4-dicarboxylate transporter [Oscillospiraceae bacterium]
MNDLVLLLMLFTIMVSIKIPIAYALGLASLGVIYHMDIPFLSAVNSMYNSVNNFSLLAVPLFMLLAQLMDKGGITDRLFKISDAFVGHIRGGLGHVNVFISLLFGHLSGSAQADAAGIGSMLIPAMKKSGYSAGFSVAITACSSTLGVIIPPSVLLVVYGAMSGASIGALFIAGFVPGFLIAIAQMIYTYVLAIKYDWPRGKKYTWKERGQALTGAIPVILLPVVILGGTSSGLFTATESAAIACLYAVVLMFMIYRNYDPKEIPAILVHTASDFSLSMFAVASAGITGWLIAYLNAPQMIADWILSITHSYFGVYVLLILFLLFIGTFLSPITAIIIFLPIIQQLGHAVHINDIHLGLIVVLTLSLGMVTPPYGSCLMITAQLGEITIPQAFKSVLPILIITIGIILLGVLFPELFLFLPRMFVPMAFPA